MVSRNSGLGKQNYKKGNKYDGSKAGYQIKQNAGHLEFNLPLFGTTIGVGTGVFGICTQIHRTMQFAPKPLVMAIIFTVLYVTLMSAVLTQSMIIGINRDDILPGASDFLPTLGLLFAGAVIVFALAALFQWIYGLEFAKKDSEPTSYIFVIDDSGSMNDNDPYQMRYSAIHDLLEQKPDDFPFMVYGFADEVYILRNMAPKSEGMPQIIGKNDGGTAMQTALTVVLHDYTSGAWDGGTYPKVVFLTDGIGGDINQMEPMNKLLARYYKVGIPVSTVGLGDVDRKMMRKIAEKTGGSFVEIYSATDLSQAIKSATYGFAKRDLVTTRTNGRPGFVYGLLRVLFLSILGAGIGFMAGVAYGMQESMDLLLLTTFVKSVLGALIMEIGTSLMGLPSYLAWSILWIFFAATMVKKYGDKITRGGAVGTLR